MDAFLTMNDIKLISEINNKDNEIICNDYTISKETIKIRPYSNSNIVNQNVISTIINDLHKGKKLIVSVSSISIAKTICLNLEKEFSDKNIILYHGENYETDCDDNGNKIYHDDRKKIDFGDVENAWITKDCVIYTGTLSVGVDFNIKHFDKFIGVYSSGC